MVTERAARVASAAKRRPGDEAERVDSRIVVEGQGRDQGQRRVTVAVVAKKVVSGGWGMRVQGRRGGKCNVVERW